MGKNYYDGLKLVDAQRFPLTTQPELSEHDQALIDAMNLDDVNEGIENGEQISDRTKARLKELEEKHRLRTEHAIANGWTSPDAKKATEPPKQEKEEQDQYRGDPNFRLTPEESAKVAKGHREMMGN